MNRFLLVSILFLVLGFTSVNAQNFSTHQVKKGETITGIANQYGVTISDIYALNPDAKKELKPNTILIIPLSKAKKPEVTMVKELVGYKDHRTSKRETLYSISKEYGITEEELKKHNTFLYANTLNKGDKLKIPVYKTIQVEAKSATKTYIVKPKEGKWRVAYKFGITVSELEALNPGMGDTLQDGQQVYVPNIGGSEEKEVDERYSYYKVLPKEGFYRLKLKLGLEQDQLEALNPDLKETGLKEGMVLKIPYTNKILGSDEGAVAKVNLQSRMINPNTKHIAIMLPFRLNRVSFDSLPDTKKCIKKDPYLDASLDFYSGALMALDSLKTLGVSLQVDVYDTKYQVSEVIKILNENNFKNVDAVIGPLTPETFDKVASGLKGLNVPVVCPIGTNLTLYDNVFQSRSSDDLLKDKIINFVKTDSLNKNIVIISDTKNNAVANDIKREFNNAKMVFSRKNKDGSDVNFVHVEDIRATLKPGKNYVFLETQNEGFASNATSILASLIQKPENNPSAIEIILVTTNFNPAFEGDQVNNEHLSKLHLHFATSSKSYNEVESNSFVKNYTKQYNTTPSKRAIKGFDLTMDVVLRLVTADDLYASVNKAPLTEYIENKFAYKKKLFGGYYNDAIYLVKYDDLSIVEVKQ
ncbi:LysM peptidoglycan-binding domain-containing protein [Mariniflexile sp.]|uniref:LysM peptidoglycan-binding domain-containing protein n=1 Tax=Mariniflexile sp. TaxID=1979402 RepID=UPI004047C000